MIGRDVFKALLGIGIGVGLMLLVKSTISYIIPILFVLAFFAVAILLIKSSK